MEHPLARLIPVCLGITLLSGALSRVEAQGFDDAAVLAANLPSGLECGARYRASVTVRNTGTLTWTAAEGYALGAVGDEDPLTFKTRVRLPDDVEIPPGESYTFNFTLTALSDATLLNLTDWRMVHEYVAWFGETASADVVIQCQQPVDAADVVSADLPARLFCGQSFAASVTVLNTGNTSWTTAGEYKLGSVGDDDPLSVSTRIYLPEGVTVPAGGTHTFTLSLQAPAAAGTYSTDWRMVHDGVAWFGGTAVQAVLVTCDPLPGADAARIVGYDLPGSLGCDQPYQAWVTVENAGSSTWSEAAEFRLAAVGENDPFASETRVFLPGGVSVPPGSTHTFAFTLVGAATAGSYLTDWRMVHDGVAFFGETAARNVAVACSPGATNAAVIQSSNFPAELGCGAAYQASLTVKNSGTTTWTNVAGYALQAVAATDPLAPVGVASIDEGVAVPPGGAYTFRVSLVGPAAHQAYNTSWRMARDGVFFGDAFAAEIAVTCQGTAVDNAETVSVSLPAAIACSGYFQASVVMKNTGNTTWSAEGGFKLGAKGDSDPFSADTRVHLRPDTWVPPGASHQFDFLLQAPETPLTGGVTDWQMVHEDVRWFGETAVSRVDVACQSPDQAQLIEAKLPIKMACGGAYQASVTLLNAGTSTWTNASGYRLGAVGDYDPFTDATRVYLPDGVAVPPGGSYTFTFALAGVPSGTGTALTDWQMVHDGVSWFGDTASTEPALDCTAFDSAQVVSADLPESLTPGASYPAAVTMRNTGNTTWQPLKFTGYALGAVGEVDPFTTQTRVPLPEGVVVPPGGSVTFTFTLVGPPSMPVAGSLLTQWQMVHETVAWFGDRASASVSFFPKKPRALKALCPDLVPDADADPTGQLPAGAQLQRCIKAAQSTTGLLEIPVGTYLMEQQIRIDRPLVFRTRGTAGSTASCEGGVSCAELVAHPQFGQFGGANLNSVRGGLLFATHDGIQIDHIVVNGNGDRRGGTAAADACRVGDNAPGVNVTISGANNQVTNVVSKNALCGSGLLVNGPNTRIIGNMIRDNGTNAVDFQGVPPPGMWSDGLTIGESANATVQGNTFLDNTDVNFISGGGPGGAYTGNYIRQRKLMAFAGLMLDNFDDESNGNFTGVTVADNAVRCSAVTGEDDIGDVRCHIGIQIGPRTWYDASPILGGVVRDNLVRRVGIGINVEGGGTSAAPVTLYSNVVEAVPGPWESAFFSCEVPETIFVNIHTADSVVNRNGETEPVSNVQLHRCLTVNPSFRPAAAPAERFVASYSALYDPGWTCQTPGPDGCSKDLIALWAESFTAAGPDVTIPPAAIYTEGFGSYIAGYEPAWTCTASGPNGCRKDRLSYSGTYDAVGPDEAQPQAALYTDGYVASYSPTYAASWTCTSGGASGCYKDLLTSAPTFRETGPDATPPANRIYAYGYIATWSTGPWSNCPVSCGGAWQHRTIVPSSWKPDPPDAARPPDGQLCNNWPCSYTCYDYGLYPTWAECYGAGWTYCDTRYRDDGNGGLLTCRHGYE